MGEDRGEKLTGAMLDAERFEELERPWRRLAERGDNVFSSYEWNEAWWHCFGDGRPLRVVACENAAAELSALVPLYEAVHRPARVLRLVGHGASDELGAIGAVAARPEAMTATRRALDADPRWGLVILDELPGDCRGAGRLLAVRSSPAVTLDGEDWSAWLAGKSRNFRQQVGKVERRLARRGRLRFGLGEDLTAFRALHEARWGPHSRAFAGRWPLHERFARAARERGWLRIHLLLIDERPVAALYNLRFAGIESCYQAGRVPALAGAGFVLHAHAIRTALEDGVREYRFLRGGEPYKLRFADTDRPVHTVAYTRGAPGTALLHVLIAAAALPAPWRPPTPARLRWGSGGAPPGGGA
jgi:CelD/BcsL family acetyltransferase involved in cellulose biosynthesis